MFLQYDFHPKPFTMNFFISKFKWVMLVSGILTSSMVIGLFSPQSLQQSNFGSAMDGALADVVVRNWAALVGLMGIMLVCGAFNPSIRRYSLIIAGTSKVIFIILVLTYGRQFLTFGAGTAVIVDTIMIVLFVTYLLFTASRKSPASIDRPHEVMAR